MNRIAGAVFFLILITWLFFSCAKDKGRAVKVLPEKFVPVSQEVKDYAYYKVGSYWIMKYGDTKQLDCTYVESITRTTSKYGVIDTSYIFEIITLKFKSAWMLGQNYFLCDNFVGSESGPIRLFLDSTLNVLHLGKVSWARIPSIEIYDTTFSNVLYINTMYTTKQTYWPEKNYWAKHVGIIGYNTYDSFPAIKVLRYKVFQ